MFAEERQQQIMDLIEKKSSLKVSELAQSFKVSESTIRRDLQEMEEKGMLTRTHGGALGISKTNFEPSFKEKETKNTDEKIGIGITAASMIEDGDTIILDSGTTTLEIAKHIKAKDITVITNSIDIAAELSSKEGMELIVTGGSLRSNTRAMVGHIPESILKNFRVDKAFIGANGISIQEGITTPNFMEAQTKKTMIAVANKVIVVSDSSKFNKVSFSIVCPIEKVTAIVTSSCIDESTVKEYMTLGVKIIKYAAGEGEN
jgi:Transcriptional regulators of sugar metabolism